MAKITMKEKVLRFVETQGEAKHGEIIRFIVDTKFGADTYKSVKLEHVYDCKKDATVMRMRRIYRGYYSGAFSYSYTGGAYFLKGANRLEKTGRGTYRVVREVAA